MIHYIKDQKGKEWAIRFSNAVAMQLAASEKVPMNMIQKFLNGFDSWPIDRVYRYYYMAFQSGARAAEKEFNMTEQQFQEWVLDDDLTVFPQLLTILAASNPDPEKKLMGKQPKK